MRVRVAVAVGGLAGIAACNLISGVEDLETRIAGDAAVCVGCDAGSPNDGGTPNISLDSALVSDVQKDGDDETPGGFLDGTFGSNGLFGSPLLDVARAMALQDDGSVVVVGTASGHVAVVRILKTGRLDTAYGSEGRAQVTSLSSSEGHGIAVDSEGRSVVVGSTTVTDDAGTRTHFLVARLAGNGSPDSAFGNDGKLVGTGNGEVATVALRSGNTIYVGGHRPGAPFVVGRVTADGKPDLTWAPEGQVVLPVENATVLHALANTSTSILAVGGANGDFAVASVDIQDGGTAGLNARAPIGAANDVAYAVALTHNGSIVLGGETETADLRSPQYGVTRLNPDGKVDTSFGDKGKVILSFANNGVWKDVDEQVRGVAVDSLNRIVVAGGIFEKTIPPRPEEFRRVALVRLRPNGQLDPLFGSEGKLLFSDTANALTVVGLAREANGKLYVLGNATTGGFYVARITP